MKRGFSLITAILFLVLIASIGALSLSLSTLTVKQTTDNFLYQQAELLLDSTTTFGLLAMSGHNYSIDCLQNITIFYPESNNSSNWTHKADVSIMYIGNNLTCDANATLNNNLTYNDSNRTVIIDTIVSTNPTISTEPIRLHRRTLQKP